MAASAVSAGWGRAVGDSPAAAALRSDQRERGACSGAPRLLRASAPFLRWRNRAAADHQRTLSDRRSLLGSPLCFCAGETERPPTGPIVLARAAATAGSGAPLGPRHVSSGAFGEAFGEGGGTEHPPLRPGVARHSFRF